MLGSENSSPDPSCRGVSVPTFPGATRENKTMVSNLSVLSRKAGQRGGFFDLESALVDPEVRGSREKIEALLHPDFFELGSSGRVYDRQAIVEMMSGEVSAGVIIRDFETRKVSKDTVLVTYRSIGQSGEEARRSSLWVKLDGNWRIQFHQGTRIPNDWGTVS